MGTKVSINLQSAAFRAEKYRVGARRGARVCGAALQSEHAAQLFHRFAYLRVAFQPAAVEAVAGAAVEGQPLRQCAADEGAQLVVGLAVQNGPLLGGALQAAEQRLSTQCLL